MRYQIKQNEVSRRYNGEQEYAVYSFNFKTHGNQNSGTVSVQVRSPHSESLIDVGVYDFSINQDLEYIGFVAEFIFTPQNVNSLIYAGISSSEVIFTGGTGGTGGQVDSIAAGSNISIDNTDPVNPEVSVQGIEDLIEFQSLLSFIRLPFSGTAGDIPTGWELATELEGSFILGSPIADIGNTGGSNSVTITQNNIPDYDLTVNDPGHQHQIETARGNLVTEQDMSRRRSSDVNTESKSTESATTGISVNSGGSGAPMNITPAFYKLAWIKKK